MGLFSIFNGVKKFFQDPIAGVKRVGSAVLDGLKEVNSKIIRPGIDLVDKISPALDTLGIGGVVRQGLNYANKASTFLDSLG